MKRSKVGVGSRETSASFYSAIRHSVNAVKSCSCEEDNGRGLMRLLEFVPCGRPAALPEDSPPSPRRKGEAAPASPRLTEEKEEAPPLSPTTFAYTDNRRRRPSHGTASPWRPSLVAISEDGAQAATKAAAAAKGGGRGGGSRTRSAKSTARILPRKERGDYWHYGVPTVVPAFAPTPFLF